MKLKFISLFLCLFYAFFAWTDNTIIIEQYSTEKGLAHETVNCILKSPDGFLWIGTWYGLCSFDGKEFKTYNSSHKFQADVPPRKIQHIIEDKYGNLWLKTTDHKLYIFDKKKERFHAIFNRLSSEFSVNTQIIKMTETEEGNFLLLTKDKDLLLAIPSEDIFVDILLQYKSDNRTGDSKLKKNILYESADYINWIGMDFSILSCKKGDELRKKTVKYISEKLSPLSDGYYYTCAFEQDDRLWLGNRTGEIICVYLSDGDIDINKTLSGVGEIRNIIPGVDSILYAAVKDKGIYRLNPKTNESKMLIPTKLNIVDSFRDDSGMMWFVTDSNSVIVFDPGNESTNIFEFHGQQQINETLNWQDGQELGMFFLATSGTVYQIDRKSMKCAPLNGISDQGDDISNKTSNLLFDDNGILWLTSYENGIFKISFPEKQFNLFNPFSAFNIADLVSERDIMPVKMLFRAKNGDIWIGNRLSEVFCFSSDGVLKHTFSSSNYNIGNVYHIMEDRQGTLWFSTKGKGLVSAIRDEKNPLGYQFKRYLHDADIANSISSNDVYYTYQDGKGRIWVATFGGGLNLMQEEQGFILFKHKYNSFSNYPEYGQYMEVRAITEGKNGRIWVGTSDGLMSFDGNFTLSKNIAFETYRNDLNISNDIYNLYKDKNGTLWLSVFGVGLNRLVKYDEEKKKPLFESFGIKDGINSDVILSIVEDDHNNLWLSTEKGISRFDPHTKTFRNYGKYDGLADFSMEETSALKLVDGTIWFGSREGILQFKPEDISDYHVTYPTYIIDMKVSNRNYDEWSTDSISIKYLDEVELKHNQSMFSIEFAALNYHTQNHVRYKYILDGYEKEWHITDKNRIASYTNVPPGRYLFRVHTVDETNPSLFSERTLQIRILPPWWKSTWAYVIYIILLLFFLYFLLRFIALMIKMKNDVYIEQKVSELKIKFFTNVSHELRTPLTLIKGPIQELKENENLSEKGAKYITLMEKNTNHMLGLVNQILDFRKIQNKKMRLHISPVRLNTLIESFYNEFSLLSMETNISYDYHLLGDNIVVWVDKEKLETVIRNIISNAFKFTPSGGSVLITGGCDEQNNTCFVRIEDNGIGIPKNKLDEIFERFTQNSSYYQGTGIGLALSKELITLHHGRIEVESIQNEGSAFTVVLPLGKEHFKESEVEFYMNDIIETDFALQTNGFPDTTNENEYTDDRSDLPNILIVEDNKSLCDFLRLQLEDSFNVHVAYDGEEGLKKVHLYYPDIVITDQMMPNVSGLELLKHIRDDFQISHIPVIILTAKDDDETQIKSMHSGANAYITKPFSKKYLIARIDQLLNDRKIFREKLWNMDENALPSSNSYGEYLIKKDVEFLRDINQIIEDNLENSDFNIDTIASSLSISRSAFFKKLKSITGLAPVDLVKETRLRKAVELIKSTDLSVSEIAFAVGFKDPGYFGKCFKKKYNLSPRDYLNEYRYSKV
ncbi:Hypothetical protein PSM36_2674 [Proteiniphilum saccharofermentans]|uniref:histidine kinase n=1 Tax=Proteiniphilum saccharofermentans TaxID=1642647 RepID=A0A1R3T2X2_9BACT|nr:hybrid sensor histidine kinase/response regulator transcription factor [Proteiniphilum saccharofermentans]SCD21470.1 Hypothetical protein PSM36_2674 [Proteiniphilum saccharofermentans]SDZ83853.1 Two component regulator propeller [Porphyromonadaceae bacterium KH3R12]SFS71502.1 Two component regulator propeller [Porphyromonadaceae bacterium NLAE-zl-C104]